MGDQRPGHRRPRHPEAAGDLVLVPTVGHRLRDRGAQPRGGAHPGRHLRHRLGERTPSALRSAPAPAPRAPQQHHRHPAAGQVPRPGAHPLLARGRHLPTARAPGRLRADGHQPHHPHPQRAARDTLHAQPGQRQQTRRIPTTGFQGPWPPPAAPEHSENQAATGPLTAGPPKDPARSRSKSRLDGRAVLIESSTWFGSHLRVGYGMVVRPRGGRGGRAHRRRPGMRGRRCAAGTGRAGPGR